MVNEVKHLETGIYFKKEGNYRVESSVLNSKWEVLEIEKISNGERDLKFDYYRDRQFAFGGTARN